MPEANAQDLSNLSLAEQRKSGGYEAINQLLGKHLNAFAISTYGAGVPFHLYLTRPINSINELQGLRVRAQPLHIPFVRSLGLNVIVSDLPELNAALEHNIVQVYVYSLLGIDDFGWQHHTAQRIDPGFYESVINILVNHDAWQNLSNEEQDSLRNASQWLEQDLPADINQAVDDAITLQAKAGISVLQAPAEFAEKARAIYWQELEQRSPVEIPKLKRLLVR